MADKIALELEPSTISSIFDMMAKKIEKLEYDARFDDRYASQLCDEIAELKKKHQREMSQLTVDARLLAETVSLLWHDELQDNDICMDAKATANKHMPVMVNVIGDRS
jgi:hypothetical protein